MTLDPPFNTLPEKVAQLYEEKLTAHQKLIDIATALASGPKSGVDYGAMVVEAAQESAILEYIDRSLFRATPLIFAVLINGMPDSEGHISRLRITRAERDRVLQFLQTDFGDKLDRPELYR